VAFVFVPGGGGDGAKGAAGQGRLEQIGGIARAGGAIGASVAALVKAAGPAAFGGSPYLLYGTVAQLRESILRRRERTGISSYGIPARRMEQFAPLVESLSGR